MAQPDGRFELRSYLHTLRQRWRMIAAITFGVVACALVVTVLRPTVYEASAEIVLQPRNTESVFTDNSPRDPTTPTVETEIRVLRSDDIRRAVRRAIGEAPAISAARVGETEVMRVTATADRADEAAQVANAYANAYVDFRKSQAVGDLEAASEQIKSKIAALQVQIDSLVTQLSEAPPAQRSVVEATLGPRYTNLLTEQGLLAQKLDSLEVDAALKSGGAQLVRAATVPDGPANRNFLRNGLVALLVGLVVGIGLAFLREHLDDSVRTKDDLAEAAPTIPVLGVIPVIEAWSGSDTLAQLRSMGTATTPAAEAYRSLRTSIQLVGVARPLRTLQVTSPAAGEGKTTLAANLAVALATAGQRVLVIDADLRRPTLNNVFQVPNAVGLTSVFAGEASPLAAVQPVPSFPSLAVVPSGPVPPNPLELLSSNRMAQVVFDLQNDFDIVLVDSAPVLPVADAVMLSAWVEATLLVTAASTTTAKAVADTVAHLGAVDARVIGTVLNRAAEATYGYGYGYGYAGAGEGADGPGNGVRRRQRQR